MYDVDGQNTKCVFASKETQGNIFSQIFSNIKLFNRVEKYT